ncbi:hypothetical protein, partial [Limnospira sp. PMC 1280.21]|uniref:hypothetical protein n=1 Tax=Limnospira sp. PMC 1280.21 TaxID=2981063 RepID=UPI0028E103A2
VSLTMTIFDYFMALAIRTIYLDLFENIIFYDATPGLWVFLEGVFHPFQVLVSTPVAVVLF